MKLSFVTPIKAFCFHKRDLHLFDKFKRLNKTENECTLIYYVLISLFLFYVEIFTISMILKTLIKKLTVAVDIGDLII